ncbi:MAG: CHASE domain-containing protein, partial [Betaproteobacteria bacterium]
MPLRPSPFRLRQPWLVLAAALLLTVLAAALAARYVQAREQAAFDAAIEASLGRLASRLDGHVALLRATRAFLQSSPAPVGHPAYETYVRRLRLGPDYPGMQGVGWSPRIDRADLAAFERAARAEGLAGFHVWPAGPRAPHFSILYLEPPDARNLAALGFDMSTEPVRAAAMDSARDSGALAMSGVVTLKQEIDQHKEAGFLVYVPVYGGDEPPATLEARRERLSGFVYAPLRSGDFFAGVLDARL